MVDVSKLVISVDSEGAKVAGLNLDNLSKASTKAQSSTDTLDQAAKKLTKQFELQARNAGKSAGQIKILELEANGATDAQLDSARAALQNAEALKMQADQARFAAKSAGATGGAFRAMRGSTQQLSWQLQDVAVQAQMGTSAFTILGQQGPQIASIFGSGGAVFGALIAFGAILAGAVYNSLSDTGDAMKDLKETNKSLIDSFDDLTEAQKAYARTLAQTDIDANKAQIKEFQKELNVLKDIRLNFSQILGFGETGFAERHKEIERIDSDIASLQEQNRKLETQTDDTTDATEDLIKKLKEERGAIGANSVVLAYQEAVRAGANDEQLRNIVLLAAQNLAAEEALQKTEENNKAIEKAKEGQKQYNANLQHQLNLLTFTGPALDEYRARIKGGTKEQQKDNAALLEKIRLHKEQIKTNADLVKARAKADADALKQGDKAQQLMEDIEQANMTELEQLKAHLIKKGGLLFQYLEEGHITLNQYLAMDAELQATYDLAEVKAKQDLSDKLLEIEAKRLEDNKTYLQEWFEQTEETLMSIDAMSVSVAEGMESGFAESFGSFLKGTATAEEAMKGLVVSVGQNMAQMIADMIAQWMAYHIMQSIMGKTTQASEATAMSLNAVAMSQMAGLAAFASTAAIPIVGPAAAPAAMMAALAITTPVAAGISALSAMAVGARAQGGQVRGGESYLVGERGPELLTMGTSGRIATNENLKNAVGGDNGNTSNVVNVNFSVQANDTAGFDRLLQSRRGQIVGMINQAVNNRGRASIV